MNKTFNLLFFVKKSKIKADGTAPVYLRITIDDIPKEISSKRNVLPAKWDSKLQKVIGNTEEVKAINAYFKTLEQEVYEAHHMMMKDKKIATSTALKSKLFGIEARARMCRRKQIGSKPKQFKYECLSQRNCRFMWH